MYRRIGDTEWIGRGYIFMEFGGSHSKYCCNPWRDFDLYSDSNIGWMYGIGFYRSNSKSITDNRSRSATIDM